ncbi:MAG: lamin tail domain-containing protein [Candidatus Thermoplasmatota archaeon]|nr:lamin tail domain-containing protein [Candidatus Thermoplasmatota archaeon]
MRRNALLLTTLMILMSLSPLVQATHGRSTACTSDICINELMPNPMGTDTGNYPACEWVELYNSGTSDINLQGWTLVDAANYAHPLDANTWVDFANLATPYVLAAGDYAIIAENNQGTLKLNNAGETLDLVDGNGNSVHTVTTGQASSDISKIPGSLATDDYVDSNTNTPGASNSGGGMGGPTYVQSELRITEVMPDPYWTNDNATWPGGEWVEIANIGSVAIDLAGWSIDDAAGNSMAMNTTHLVGSGTMIDPGQHRIVAVNGTRTYGMLNNGAGTEQIKLRMPSGEVTHQVEYSGPTHPGHSYVNTTASTPDWGRNANPLNTAKWPTPETNNPPNTIIPQPQLQMNEILANASSTGSWVELYYPEGNEMQNISTFMQGYEIRTGTGLFASEMPESDAFQTDKFLVFFTTLMHNYDSLSLVDYNGDIRQVVEWNSPQQEDLSIIPSDPMQVSGPWMQSPYNTPGTYNPGQFNGSEGNETIIDVGLRISEFLPNPIGSDSQTGMDGEWVEIVNTGNQSVDLTGWELRSGSGFSLPPATLLPGDYMVYPLGDHSITLTNNQGTLELNDPEGNSTHSVVWDHSAYGMSMVPGATPNDVWVIGAWPTPGAANLLFEQPYSGPTEILMSEVSPQCSNPTDGLASEWVEFYNTAGYAVNLSRWMVQDEAGGAAAVAPGRLWNLTEESMILEVGDYAVLNLDDNLLTNQGETITLLDPNGNAIQTLSWDTSTDCTTLESRNGGSDTRETLWPTPGDSNPIIHSYDGGMTIKFTRFMPVEVSGRSNDWFEITNTGDTWVDLGGWVIERLTADSSHQSLMLNHILEPGQSVVITEEPSNLIVDGGPDALDADNLFSNSPPWLINSGGALQLVAPDGTVVDAFVYGSGFADIDGWDGLALEMPPSDGAGLILMRGDGCNVLPDTDTSSDWEYRWLRLGSSLFCDSGFFATDGSIIPVNSPVGALHQMVEWINGANSSLHLHIYQFDSPELYLAIEAAVIRGVECTILLEGQILGDAADNSDQRGWADELANAGCTVLWMVEPEGANAPMGPYRYIHSKVAVRDGDSVWIGSGNWKRSTFPLDGDSGNRDSGVIVNSQDVADLVMSRLLWDENESQRHIINLEDAPTSMGRPTGWVRPTASTEFGPNEPMPLTYDGPFGARLLTCPDDCIQSLVELIDEAEVSLDIAVQYFDLGWHWGYGDNPLIEAIEDAANDGVSVRLLINGYYMDDGIQETVNHFNHRLNMTDGLPVEARIMAPSDDITKLHDKSMIVDGEWSLFSSINWGSNSALRNREMGLAIQHIDLAQHQTLLFEDDWNRLDTTTDTDGDGMPDYWEIENGLNRSWSAVQGSTNSEQNLDPDGDGLANLQEFQNGGDAQNPDTDGDCIHDGDEVVWAWNQSLDASLAVQTPDANLDGVPDNETVGCTNPEDQQQNIDNQDDSDDDDDESGPFREDAMDNPAAKVLLAFVVLAAISLFGALGMMFYSSRRESAGNVLVDDVGDISGEIWAEEESGTPDGAVILDGTSVGPNAGSDAREVSVGRDDGVFGAPQLDGYDFPGWSPQQVQESLDAGWTIEQLREKYDSEQ